MATKANKIATVIIPTADQDAAIDFYVNKLGFELRADTPFGGDMRWIEVGLAGESTTIALAPPPPGVSHRQARDRHQPAERRHRRLPRAAQAGGRRRGRGRPADG